MLDVINRPSPNFDAREPAVPLQFVVLHYTGMKSGEAALQRLCDPAAKVSAHYVIEEDGRVFMLVNENSRAWHAGKSSWRGVTDLNSASIGIELVNPGHQYGYRPFANAQIGALKVLLADIMTRHRLPPSALLAHADVAPERKEDPGELFPWRELAEAGIGLWANPVESDYAFAEDGEVQEMLRGIGYECPASGAYDQPTRAAIIAFQRHYHPENLTGTPERETVARLRSLKRILAESIPAAESRAGSPRPAA